MRLVAAGLDFRSAPLQVREQAAVAAAEAPTVLRWLVGHAGVSGAAVLSTCNRTEFYLACPSEPLADRVAERLGFYLDGAGRRETVPHLVVRRDAEALRHLFRVAAGLESMLVGEAQVLGQLKAAHRLAREAGTLDARLDYLLRRAVSVGKRVRTDTGISRGAGSLGALAVEALEHDLGDLRDRGVLLVGAGKMAGLAAARLRAAGATLYVCSLGGRSARRLAEEGGEAIELEDVRGLGERIDAVISSTSTPGVVLDVALLRDLQQRRGERLLSVVDLAVPRDVAPEAGAVAGVRLHDVDHLGGHLGTVHAERRTQVEAAARIVEEELERAITALDERDAAAPAIATLTRNAEALRSAEVARSLRGRDTLDHEQVEALTRSLVRKLLHGPITHLRERADDPDSTLWLREAFGLDGEVHEGE